MRCGMVDRCHGMGERRPRVDFRDHDARVRHGRANVNIDRAHAERAVGALAQLNEHDVGSHGPVPEEARRIRQVRGNEIKETGFDELPIVALTAPNPTNDIASACSGRKVLLKLTPRNARNGANRWR